MLGRARTGLEFGGRDELLAHLPDGWPTSSRWRKAAGAVAARYFGQTRVVAWQAG